MITDLDAWRRVCLEAYNNLTTDTTVTMSQIDAVLLAGARETVTLDTSTDEGESEYVHQLDRVSAATGVEREDVDAILTWCAADADALNAHDAAATDYKRIREVLATIVEDMEADTYRREGQPFNGRTVAAALGEISATIAALANIVKELLPPTPSTS